MAASTVSRELFSNGVRAALHSWPVLQIAVDNGFGGVYGAQKAEWLVDVVQQYFHDNADLQQYEVEDYISQLMDQEFDTVVDDGSLPQVCTALLQMFSQYKSGSVDQLSVSIKALTHTDRARATATATATHTDTDSEEDTQEMETEASPSETHTQTHRNVNVHKDKEEEAEDGWTVVRKKK